MKWKHHLRALVLPPRCIVGIGPVRPNKRKSKKKHVYPKYYNFDELSAGGPGGNRDIGRYAGDVILGDVNARGYGFAAGGMKSLECLREEVAGELAWRSELIDELGYLGGIVV